MASSNLLNVVTPSSCDSTLHTGGAHQGRTPPSHDPLSQPTAKGGRGEVPGAGCGVQVEWCGAVWCETGGSQCGVRTWRSDSRGGVELSDRRERRLQGRGGGEVNWGRTL